MITLPLLPIYAWLLVFLRAGLMLIFFPLIGEVFVPVRVRLVLAIAIALAIWHVVPVTAAMFPTTLPGIVRVVACEVLLAFGVGLIAKVLFATVQYSGQIAGEQMGFGIINAIDPTGAHQISVVAEMQYLLAILVFLTADLHHVLFEVLVQSFSVLPPGGAGLNGDVTEFMTRLGTLMFSFSLRFAMPVVVIIFAINVALGMIARAVPQINVFMESFPLRIIAGVALMMMTLGTSVALWGNMFGEMQGMMVELMRAMAR